MTETPEEFVAYCRSKGQSEERIIEVLCRKLNREREFRLTTSEKLKTAKSDLNAARREAGRLITAEVTHIIKDGWKTYCWYKHSRFVYRCDGIWTVDDSKNQNLTYQNHKIVEGKIKVNLLLDDKNMPPKYTGVADGRVNGKNIILCGDFLVNHGDEFVMTKKGEK